jgi:4-diphosphocytidyl-2-C-methyl-D-erythritol kinase
VTHARAYAKLNLGLVVGPLRPDGKHEVVTLLQRIDLHDDVSLAPAPATVVDGFDDDTIVTAALAALADEAGVEAGWRVSIAKRIPVAAGLGGGSADAAAALTLANATLRRPLDSAQLEGVAAQVGADVPFFLKGGSCVATGDGTELRLLHVTTEYTALLLVPADLTKESTGAVYEAFDRRSGAEGFDRRTADFERALEAVSVARDLAFLPPNDLASSPVAEELAALGAFRADVTGAGPTVYGLFEDAEVAVRAEEALRPRGRTYVTRPI